MKAATAYLSKQNPLMLAAGAALLIGLVYVLARKTVTDTAKMAGGIVSGETPWTEGTAYEGAGIFGTVAGGINSALPFLDNVGEWIASKLPDGYQDENLFYIVTFPDGARHSVPSTTVGKDGAFTYKGTRYILGMQGGRRVAKVAA